MSSARTAIEPVATRLGYWSWAGDGVPWRNYAAWFLTAFCTPLP